MRRRPRHLCPLHDDALRWGIGSPLRFARQYARATSCRRLMLLWQAIEQKAEAVHDAGLLLALREAALDDDDHQETPCLTTSTT